MKRRMQIVLFTVSSFFRHATRKTYLLLYLVGAALSTAEARRVICNNMKGRARIQRKYSLPLTTPSSCCRMISRPLYSSVFGLGAGLGAGFGAGFGAVFGGTLLTIGSSIFPFEIIFTRHSRAPCI